MKVGRNSLCPCGSGEKYKKCCLKKKSVQTAYLQSKTAVSAYDYTEGASRNISAVLSKYKAFDIIRAIFCINSWIHNRSALAQTLTLNRALLYVGEFGKQSIDTYSELEILFNSLSNNLIITRNEDLTLNDFGEVKLIVDGIAYPVILGTGHEQVYNALSFVQTLAEIMKKEEELVAILEYGGKIINSLQSNIKPAENEIKLEIPSAQFWDEVVRLFSDIDYLKMVDVVAKIMIRDSDPIEKIHFMVIEGRRYPLYNTSLVIDYYNNLLCAATKEEVSSHVKLTILNYLENAFNFSDSSPERVLIAPVAINRSNKEKAVMPVIFLAASSRTKRVVVGIDQSDCVGRCVLKDEIHKVDELYRLGELSFCEGYPRKNVYAVDVSAEMTITYVLVNNYTNVTQQNLGLRERGDLFECSALDLMCMLYFMDDFDELMDFVEYNRNEKAQIFAFGGKSSIFLAWKQAHHQIVSGALEFGLISLPYGTDDEYAFDYFSKKLRDYPFCALTKMFDNPHYWRIGEPQLGFTPFDRKGCIGFGGDGKMAGNTFIFLAHNTEFFKFDEISVGEILLVDELNKRLFNRYGKMVSEIFPMLRNGLLQLLYMPMSYARKVDNSGFTSDAEKTFVYSDIFVENNVAIIRYAVNSSELFSRIKSARDRSVEIEYFMELVAPLRTFAKSQKSYDGMCKYLEAESRLQKEVSALQVEIDYYFNDKMPLIDVDDKKLVKARKIIAQSCQSAGVKPGKYKGKAATGVVRAMQSSIVKLFEARIACFKKMDLHRMLLRYYAGQMQDVITNMKRLQSFNDLAEDISNEFRKKTIEQRETNKRNIRTAQYLIESNLCTKHDDNAVSCDNKDVAELLAVANWIVVLQDNSDNCYFNEMDVVIEVDGEYRVDTEITDSASDQYEKALERKYSQNGYYIKNDDIDKFHFDLCVTAFSQDTQVDFRTMMTLLEYLKRDIANIESIEILQNVFEISKKDIVDSYLNEFVESGTAIKCEVEKALDFITLDCDNLKSIEGKVTDILPIWQREKRDNRFDIKPIVLHETKCVFSPITLKHVQDLWGGGMTDWHLPYEIGLSNLVRETMKWKNRYEREMVSDIASYFEKCGYRDIYVNVELSSLFPKSGYPQELGDYDVFVISKEKREIWLIESKVLQKVASIYEDQMQQRSFFFQHRDDERFQRRIDYVVENIEKIKASFEVNGEYAIRAYMVTNKLFISRYKKIQFPIVTCSEMEEILRENSEI